jgi:uncharacterized membrane protein YesL
MTRNGPRGEARSFLSKANLAPQTYESIFSVVWSGLAINVMLGIINAPLILALTVVAEPFRSWPIFLVLSLALGPCMSAVFYCFDQYRAEGKIAPFGDLMRGFRRHGGKALGIWVGTLITEAVLLVDLIVLQQTQFGPLATPPLVMLMVVVLLTSINMLWANVQYPQARIFALIKVSLYVGIRRWQLTLFTVVLLGALVYGIALQPTLGLLIGPALALHVVFNNCRQGFLLTLEPNQVQQLPYQRPAQAVRVSGGGAR